MRISDWSSGVCSSDLAGRHVDRIAVQHVIAEPAKQRVRAADPGRRHAYSVTDQYVVTITAVEAVPRRKRRDPFGVPNETIVARAARYPVGLLAAVQRVVAVLAVEPILILVAIEPVGADRSEERRVGKEW